MLTLAIENSAPVSSVALLRDDRVLASEAFRPERRGQERIFDLVTDVLRREGLEVAEIGRYIVGRGPGNYTGMRIALTLAQSLALPGGDEVLAVSSGAALARDLLKDGVAGNVAVFGDARRGMYWVSVFRDDEGLPRAEFDWRLCSAADLCPILRGVPRAASSELERVGAKIDFDADGLECVIRAARYPRAASLAAIARGRIERGIAPEAREPLYLHPAVG